MNLLAELLKKGNHSLVVANNRLFLTFDSRGVRDLYDLFTQKPEVLDGARVADKVVGKGAAALMILGKVSDVYAVTISRPALDLFRRYSVSVTFENLVDNIINREGTGICPVENLCSGCDSPRDALPLISSFIDKMRNK